MCGAGAEYDRSYSFLTAVPTAELEPLTETYVQADEVSKYSARPTGVISCRSLLTLYWVFF
jgi:hypothetical protein